MTAAETAALAPALPTPAPHTPGRSPRLLGRLVTAGLALSFLVTCFVAGLPTDRIVLLGWVVVGLAVHAALDGPRRVGRVLADWVPLAALLLLYDASRGIADGFGATVLVAELAEADRWLFGGALPTVVLQQHWDAGWWQALAAVVYSSHFVVMPVLLGALWVRDRSRWIGVAGQVVALSMAGLVTYVVLPAAPPWLAAKEGVIEPVQRLSGAGWEVLGLPRAGALLADGQGQVNRVAAIPSLHTGFAVLVCLVLLPVAARVWQRVALVSYAVLMPLVLVWAGEHYVVDTLLGAAYAAAVVLAAAGLRRVRARGRRSALPPPREAAPLSTVEA